MVETKPKIKMAVYWGAACGGCCVSVLDVHEKLFTVVEHADLVFWPIALDIKYKDVEAMPDGHIDLCLFNGAVRNSENEHMAKLLRAKTKVLVAYGSCSHMGGIPGLANFTSKEELLKRVYETTESTVNPDNIRPEQKHKVKEGVLELPEFYNDVRTLDQVVEVDYYLPGCPPQTERLVEVFLAIVTGAELPPAGSVIGALNKSQCDECKRTKTDNKKIREFKRPIDIVDDGETCFLEQGVICMGPATRGGCGVRCIEGNAPCRGCYGPPEDVPDPGSKMLSAVATMIDGDKPEEIAAVVDTIDDPAGTFYRFSLPGSILRRKVL
ncbi:MAG: oxidoreductase [Bacteroidetes bacterium]|jgi:F420-non-reducing hydrogenase small subunit|nr:oxidoreductase [Bacteroidota bacterium]MBT5528189.1 oxidoreductase [Cytophagia bacterium]MBT3422122.1 oxidoreductase [Bacteroidota bacterium]MBT3801700.1 oxidoreductase [Bacteroidota bacterium]MBT4337541.1 oxidoreductase [Bacteroidota bacterium]